MVKLLGSVTMGLYYNRVFLALPKCLCHLAVGVFTPPQLVSLLLEANCARGLEIASLSITEKPPAPPPSTIAPLPASLTMGRQQDSQEELGFNPITRVIASASKIKACLNQSDDSHIPSEN